MEKATQSAQQFNIPNAFDSVEALCRCPEVDAVLVTTPNSLHLADTLTSLRLGKPVLCEKPMGINADECRQMVETARQSKLLLGVAQVFRFEDSTARLRDRLAAGQIGKPVLARAEFSFPGRGHVRAWLNDASIAGGGPIADIGVHCVDALRYILQDDVVRVSARGIADTESRDVEAAAILTLEFERGTLATVMVSFRSDYRTPIEFIGESGVLRADDGLNVEYPITIELKRGGKIVESEIVTNKLAYARQVDSFADALEGKSQFPVPGEEGWQNQIVLDAAFRSLRSGKVEDVARVPRF
jgi:1,5-anhydro-D-fructose reductase (1,5-anhydro-D-mannitol-forming)